MLTQIHPDLFVRSVPYRAMGFPIDRQLVVARLPGGKLWVQSPLPWTPELRAAVARLGEVRHVMAASRYHDECLKEFQAEYPAALFHAVPGLATLRPDLRFAPEPLSDTPHADWAGSISQHLVRGMPRINEVVFLHRPSRSLILSDLAFNFGHGSHWLLKLMMRLDGAWGRLSPTRFGKSQMKDRAAVRASIYTLLAWDFDRIIVGHGHNIETGGKDALRAAFAFLNAK